jgi:Na+/H+ antiporter 1
MLQATPSRKTERFPNRRRPASTFRALPSSEAAGGGLVLMAAAVLALVVANSPLAPIYFAALETCLGPLSILHWINDGLMAVFFLLVGLEIKRELLGGQLRTCPDRALLGLAAAGGMLVPVDPAGARAAALERVSHRAGIRLCQRGSVVRWNESGGSARSRAARHRGRLVPWQTGRGLRVRRAAIRLNLADSMPAANGRRSRRLAPFNVHRHAGAGPERDP